MQDRYGFDVIHIVTLNEQRSREEELSESLGFITAYNRYDTQQVLSPTDLHPTVERHYATAELLSNLMQSSGLIDKYRNARA